MADETKQPEEQQKQPEEGANPEPKTYSEADYNALKAQLETATTQLTEANDKIKGFADMDVEKIKNEVADYREKFEASQKQIAQMEYSTKLEKFVEKQGCKNAVYADYLKRQIEAKQLKFDGETLLGGEDVVKALRESCPDAFASEGDKKPEFVASTPGGNNKSMTDDMVRRVLGLK